MTDIQVRVMLDEGATVPTSAYDGDAGWDLHVLEPTHIYPKRGVDVRTGVSIAIPEGFYGRIVGRSSAFRKRGLLVIEGIIDAGFRGELYSFVYNPGETIEVLEPGDSVAQLILVPVPSVTWLEVPALPESARGVNGFGSSGR